MDKNLVYRFAALFDGNKRSYGVWDKNTGKMSTNKGDPGTPEFAAHLQGGVGLGVVPIRDDNTVIFSVVDIDNHGTDKDIELTTVVKACKDKNYPVLCCRSKSGGVHVYVFYSEPVPAHRAIALTTAVASNIGYPSSEIFPKQDRLMDSPDGEKALGNWVNLCYFNGDKGNRKAVTTSGRAITLEEFIDAAESRRLSAADVDDILSAGHVEAPPCIQRMYNEGVPAGYRNQALYNITVYLRKAKPDTFVDDALDANNQIFDRPLPATEAKRTIKSASRRDYRYKCGEEPCKAYCDSRTCVTRLYGITPDEETDLRNGNNLPVFSGLTKYNTEPPRWGFSMDGKKIEGVDTEELFNFNALRKAVAAKLNLHIPNMPMRRWDSVLSSLFVDVMVVDVPKEASASGQAVARLSEYLAKADSRLVDGYDENKERAKLTRGMPCIQFFDGVKYGAFRMTDFVKHLKNTRSEDLKGANLYFALREHLAVETKRIRVSGKPMTVWAVPMDNLQRVEVSQIEFKPEF